MRATSASSCRDEPAPRALRGSCQMARLLFSLFSLPPLGSARVLEPSTATAKSPEPEPAGCSLDHLLSLTPASCLPQVPLFFLLIGSLLFAGLLQWIESG